MLISEQVFTLKYSKTSERIEISWFYGVWNEHHILQHLWLVHSIQQYFFDTSNSDKVVFIVAVLLCNICDQTKYIYLVVAALFSTYNRYTDSDREMWSSFGGEKIICNLHLFFFFVLLLHFVTKQCKRICICWVEHVMNNIDKLGFLICSFLYVLFSLLILFWSSVMKGKLPQSHIIIIWISFILISQFSKIMSNNLFSIIQVQGYEVLMCMYICTYNKDWSCKFNM